MSLRGPGGGGTSQISKVGMISSSSRSERPASEPYAGKQAAVEANNKTVSTVNRTMFLVSALRVRLLPWPFI